MVKKVALILALLMVAFLIWMLLGPMHGVRVTIDGHTITGPIGGLVDVWGVLVAGVVLFCVAVLLAFVFVGVGLVVLGTFALVGLILAAVALPFLLPLLIPLFIVWLFCCMVRKSKA
ncbi:MAG: hypothetical protein ACYS6I_00410 [Planctomycetota bacterium]|jgi:hypothetical protein